MLKKDNIKKIILIALVAVFAVFVCLYLRVVAFNNGAMLDIVPDNEASVEIPITDGLILENSFTYDAEMLRGIMLKFAYEDEAVTAGEITVDLYDVGTGGLLGSCTMNYTNINNIDYTVFPMPDVIGGVNGKELKVVATFRGFAPNQAFICGAPSVDYPENVDFLLMIISAGEDAYYGLMSIVFLIVIVAIVIVFAMVLFGKKFKLEKVYLVSGLLLGFVMTLLIPVGAAPDEFTHIYMAYQRSNDMMGVESIVDGTLTMRYEDAVTYFREEELDRLYFNEYYERLFDKVTDDTLVDTGIQVAYAPEFLYFFSGLGITLGRLMGLGTTMTFLLGRWLNMLFFVFMTYFAIKKLPFGKGVAFVWALIPTMLQQTGSYSYDCVIDSLCILIIAMTLRFMYGEKHENRKTFIIDVVILALACILLIPCKNGAFLPVVVMPLMLLVKYIKNNWSKIKDLFEKKPVVKKTTIGVIIVGVLGVIAVALVVLKGMAANADGDGAYVEWAQQYAYPAGYYVKNPVALVSFFVNTLWVSGEAYLSQMFGGYLGWLDIWIPFTFIVPFMLLMIYAGLRREDEEQLITVGNKLWMWLIFLGVSFIACLGMLLYWTPVTSQTILGVQGRYFLPAFVPAMIAIRTKKTCVSKDADKIVACLVPFMYVFIATAVFKNII